MLEPFELYAAKSGREIAKEQTYNFLDRGGREVSIRPEMTPTVSRMVAAKINELNFPLKWFSIPNLYRYERPQRGRLREHWQVNADIFGCDSIEADLEIIYLSIQLLNEFGADENMFKVHINSRRFFSGVMRTEFNLDENAIVDLSKIIDKKNKIKEDEYIRELSELGFNLEEIHKMNELFLMNLDELISRYENIKGAEELHNLFEHINNIGIEKYCIFDFSIMRGLDYYTDTVFEVFDESPDNRRALFGGGRYNNLLSLFDEKNNITGVGFGFGDVTLENFLYSHSLIQNEFIDMTKVLILRLPEIPYDIYSKYHNILIDWNISASIYLGNKKLGKQIEYAVKEGYTDVLIIGENELDKELIIIRNLKEKKEIEIKTDELLSYFKNIK